MTTRFRTRAFVLCFVPFAVLLAGSFLVIQRFVQSTVRDGLRTSLRENQLAIADIHAKVDLQNSRFLKVVGENAALKAGMKLFRSNTDASAARRTVEDQLRELGQHMGFDFLLVSAPNGAPIAGVLRQAGTGPGAPTELVPLGVARLGPVEGGLMMVNGHAFQVASVPIDLDDENLGALSVGQLFDFSEFTTPAVLVHHGRVIESNIPGVPFDRLDAALAGCRNQSECDLRLDGGNWISLPFESYRGDYLLRSLQNVDQATLPIQSRLNNLFLSLSAISVLLAFLCSLGASRTIVKPLGAVVSHLRGAVDTGVLPELEGHLSSIREVKDLVEIYNRAAVSVRAAGEDLQAAYLEFVGSLANALDARDRYTSGHSRRVSGLACAIATAMQLRPGDVERIRIGALLHDMGKIGIADSVLQKPGKLTDEEFALVKEHPVIGRRILEGVQGLAPFLPAVELHHENWNGTGYPRRQSGEETPIDARIIHVSDAYDAMTTDRSYRSGMSHEKALSILREEAGRQFDPRIVEVFLGLPREILTRHSAAPAASREAEESQLAVVA